MHPACAPLLDPDASWPATRRGGGITLLPLPSPTIPPATHTTCALVGARRFIIIDPGSHDPQAQQALAAHVTARMDAGDAPLAIVLTHHHIDHVSGVLPLQEMLGPRVALPIWAHRRTAEALATTLRVERHLEHLERIDEVGDADALECLHTPGHASGHLSFAHPSGLILCGDMVASEGTILVAPPDGHMGEYLASLRALVERAPVGLIPSHGRPIANPNAHLRHYIDHRLAREEKVADALRAHGAWASAAELAPVVYAEISPTLWPLAARSLSAHLEHLAELGLAEQRGPRWRAV